MNIKLYDNYDKNKETTYNYNNNDYDINNNDDDNYNNNDDNDNNDNNNDNNDDDNNNNKDNDIKNNNLFPIVASRKPCFLVQHQVRNPEN